MSSGIVKSNVLDLTGLSYSRPAYDFNVDELISNAETQLYGHKVDFDSMVGIGLSGLLVLPLLARHFNVPFFACRKGEESHHNSQLPEGGGRIGRKWLLVDDAKVSGTTIKKVNATINAVADRFTFQTQFAGTYLYNKFSNTPGAYQGPGEYDEPDSVRKVFIDGKPQYIPSDMFFRIYTMMDKHSEEDRSTAAKKTMEYFSRFDFRGWGENTVRAVVNYIDQEILEKW